MSTESIVANGWTALSEETTAAPPSKNKALFRATVARFEDERQRSAMDRVADWVHDELGADLEARPSRHLYVSTLPADVLAQIDVLRDDPLVEQAIRAQFPSGVKITSMKTTDELYISHYNKDLGGDEGLFGKHYDGNLRFVPYGAVVRALMYVRSDGSYKVVFHDSGVAKGFETYDLGLLDFHRELHWVEGKYEEHGADRIVLKINYLVVPEGNETLRKALLGFNLFQFYVVKFAMENSKSPKTVTQRAIGLLCNVVRVLNNVHPILPHVLFLGLLATGLGGIATVVGAVLSAFLP